MANLSEVSGVPALTAAPPPLPRTTAGLGAGDLVALAQQFRRDVIELTWHSGTGSSHLGGELSLAEIVAVLYANMLRLDPTQPRWEGRDRLVLSKGHASAMMYVAMAWRGFFPRERLFDQFNRVGGFLQEHANLACPGVEVPTGSLGMGLSAAAGMAWGAKRLAGEGPHPSLVYAILSDGECQSGQTWEAAMAASHHGLDNLIAIVDYNHMVVTGRTELSMNVEPLRAKWEGFGWHVTETDGHDVDALGQALSAARTLELCPGRPRVIIAHTTKGKGVSFTEGDNSWHAGHLNEALYRQALADLAAGEASR